MISEGRVVHRAAELPSAASIWGLPQALGTIHPAADCSPRGGARPTRRSDGRRSVRASAAPGVDALRSSDARARSSDARALAAYLSDHKDVYVLTDYP